MSLFGQSTFNMFRTPTTDKAHDYTSVIRRFREEPEETRITSLRVLAGRRFVQEAHLFFEELQLSLSSVHIQGKHVDELWYMLDWYRLILALWTEEFKATTGVVGGKWVDLVEHWTTVIKATLTPILKYASPSYRSQRSTIHDGVDGLSFEKSLADDQYIIGMTKAESAMVHSIVAATSEKAWDTPLLHYLAFTDMIYSVKDDLEQTESSVNIQSPRRRRMESSEFEGFVLVLAKEIKSLVDLLPSDSQDAVLKTFSIAIRKALTDRWPAHTVRSLKFHHTLISSWPSRNPAIELELETLFQARVQGTFGTIITPSKHPSRWDPAPNIVEDLQDVLALGADINGKISDYYSNCCLWAAAASAASVAMFQALIHAGAPYTDGSEGRSPLHAAASAGNLGIVAFILANNQHSFNVDVNVRDENYDTALHKAAEAGNEAVVNFLLDQHGIKANCRNRRGYTPFLVAIESTASGRSKKNATIKTLLRSLLVDCNLEPQDSFTARPLHLAAKIRDDSLRLIIRHVHGINIQDGRGATPLHEAVEGNSGANVEILLRNGADPTLVTGNGLTPLLLACNRRHLGPMKILLRRRDAFTAQCPLPVQGVSSWGTRSGEEHFSPVTLVLNDISAFGKQRMAHVGYALEIILAAKPDLEVRDGQGRSVLNRVYHSVNGSMLLDIVRAGADVNSQDDDGRTPLHRLFQNPDAGSLELLLRYGADLDVTDYDGWPALPSDWESQERGFDKKVLRMIWKVLKERRRLQQEKELKMLAEKAKAYATKQKDKKKAERDGTLAVVNRFSALAVEDTGDGDDEVEEDSK